MNIKSLMPQLVALPLLNPLVVPLRLRFSASPFWSFLRPEPSPREPRERPLKARFPDLYFGKFAHGLLPFMSARRPLEPPVTIEHRLEPLFYAEASALVGPSISGVICLKKARMSPYPGTNSNPSCVGTSGILELL